MNPLDSFIQWIEEARSKGEVEPTTCVLATSNTLRQPSARFMLFKGVHDGKLAFVTNFESRKGREMNENSRIAVAFFWPSIQKQVRFEGRSEAADSKFSDEYWKTRPRESQIGAWASPQSRPIESYEALQTRCQAIEKEYEGRSIPRPPHWGAFFLRPELIELWEGQLHRLHRRTLYKKKESAWIEQPLAP